MNLALIDHYDELLTDVELTIARTAKVHDPHAFHRLRTTPGIGKILVLVILYEVHAIGRFPSVGNFVSYCRLVKCQKVSDGKHYRYAGTKIGNAHLKWAFSEAAVLFLRKNTLGRPTCPVWPRSTARPRRLAAMNTLSPGPAG
jgi:transposase